MWQVGTGWLVMMSATAQLFLFGQWEDKPGLTLATDAAFLLVSTYVTASALVLGFLRLTDTTRELRRMRVRQARAHVRARKSEPVPAQST